MKKLLFIIAGCLFLYGASAQSYVYVKTTGTSAPYNWDDPNASVVLDNPNNDVLSSWQTIPFTFNFYGTPVTGYYASDNGYITFDNAATTSTPTNDTPPSVSGPNNAIYGFWDDIDIADNGSGQPDQIRSFTYGSAGQRTHVIQWVSATKQGGTSADYIYLAIRLHECGDFDIIYNWGNATGWSATAGCENAAGDDATLITGSPTLDYPSVGSGETDDEVYHFYYLNQPTYDLSVTDINVNRVIQNNSNTTVKGTVTNNGSQAITSFDINYSIDGGAAVTSNLSANVTADGGTYNFTHPTPFTTTSSGLHTIDVWASNLNGNADDLPCNDTMQAINLSGDSVVPRNVLMEEFTSSTCAPCASQNPAYNSLLENNSVNTNGGRVVSVKNQMNWPSPGTDPSYNPDGLGRRTYYGVNGVPTCILDGVWPEGSSYTGAPANLTQQMLDDDKNIPSIFKVEPTYSLNGNTVDVSVVVTPYATLSTTMTLHISVTEDYYSYTGGTTSETEYYDVMRKMLPNSGGTTIGPFTANTPITVNESYTFSINNPPPQNSYDLWIGPENVNVVAFIQDDNTFGAINYVHQAGFYKLSGSGVEDATSLQGAWSIFPNPATDVATIQYKLPESGTVRISMVNTLGEVISTLDKGVQSSGTYTTRLDLNNLPSGIYMVRFEVNGISATRKLSVR